MNTIRPLSLHETSFPIYAQCSPGAGNLAAVLRIDGPLTAEAFVSAVHAIAADNPVLRSTHTNLAESTQTPRYAWMTLDAVSDIECTVLPEGQDIDSHAHMLYERLLNLPFARHQALTRYRLVSQGERHIIAVAVDHAMLDGGSTVGIFQRLLARLAGLASPVPQREFPPALWSYMPKILQARSGFFRCLDVFGLLVKLQKQADVGLAFAVEAPAPMSEHRAQVHTLRLSSEETARILNFGKTHGVGWHGLLGAALLRSLVDHLRRIRGDAFCRQHAGTPLPLVTTMDLRKRTEPPLADTMLGCLSSGATHVINALIEQANVSASDYVTMAQQVMETLNAQIERHQHWKLLRIYQTFGAGMMKKIFKDASEKPMSMPVSIANLGRIDMPAGDRLRVVSFAMAPAFHPAGPSVNGLCYTLNGEFTLNMAAGGPQLSRETLAAYTQGVMAHLRRMGEGAP